MEILEENENVQKALVYHLEAPLSMQILSSAVNKTGSNPGFFPIPFKTRAGKASHPSLLLVSSGIAKEFQIFQKY